MKLRTGRLRREDERSAMLDLLNGYAERVELQQDELLAREQALQESRERLSTLLDFAPVGLVELDDSGVILSANRRAAELLGLPGEKLLSRRLGTLIEDVLPIGEHLRGLREEASAAVRVEREVHVKCDRTRLVGLQILRTQSDDEKPIVWCALTDVSEAHRTREVLREREERARAITDSASSAILTTGLDLRVETANRAARVMFGCKEEDLVGSDVRTFVSCPALDSLAQEAASSSPLDQPTPCTGRTLRGQPFPAEMTVASYRSGTGSLYVIVVQDVTERKRLQREIMEMGERERRRIGRDLHDSLGQQMVGIGMLAQDLALRLRDRDPWMVEASERIVKLLNDVISQTRDLARRLHPVELESKGLLQALRALAHETTRNTGTRTEVRVHERTPFVADGETATHLYRIVQEAVHNAIRHGQPKGIFIRVLNNEKGLELSIVDDGPGLPPGRERGEGMGLRLMAERAGLVGGTLTVSRHGQQGTIVRCVVPRQRGQDLNPS